VVPDNLRFGGGVSGTVFNPIVAIILFLAVVLICVLPRKKAIAPFLITVILIPADQILVLGGLHFNPLRILIFFGLIRIFIIKGRGEWSVFSGGLNKLDKSMILLTLTSAVAGILLFRNIQAAIFQVGEIYTAFGAYFLLRCLIRDREDVVRVIRVFALIVIMLGGVMIFEHLKGSNPYALLGGARAQYFATNMARDGRIRATASFGTPILAGTFGAVLLPVFIGLWLTDKKQRQIAIVGMIGATIMTAASSSSTPLITYMLSLMGLCMWPIRSMMRAIRWGIVLTLVALQMVMKAPVYHLVTRLDISGSSYHRYALIDQCVHHFSQWWLIGTKSNADWGWDMWDTANQYVQTAQNSGLFALILLIAIIVFGFKYLGKARQATTDKKQALFLWALGSALFAQLMSFLGISLWDQSIVGWYALLAFIAAVAVPQAQAAKGQIETVANRGMAAGELQPAYPGLSYRPRRDRKSVGDERPAPLRGRHARGF
jgi:hypothetical protein